MDARTRLGALMIESLIGWAPLVLRGFLVDIWISVGAMLLGTIAGVFVGAGQISRLRVIRFISLVLTQFFRNAPWLVLLFFFILLLPFQVRIFGTQIFIPGEIKAIIGLALPVMGNVSEVVRGGIESIPSGQWEAANSLALNRKQTFRMVIIPQALKRMLPPWMNIYAILVMGTPLVSIVGVQDSVYMAQAVLDAERNTAYLMPVYGSVLVLFFIYCSFIAFLVRRLELKFSV